MLEPKRISGVILTILALLSSGTVVLAKPDADLHKQYNNLIGKQDYKGAIEILAKAIALNPKDAAIFDRRAECYNWLKLYDKAVADCDTALGINRADFIAYGNRANAYSHLGKIDQAIADYTKQAELQSTNPQPYAARAYVYKNAGKRQAAIDDFTKAIAVYTAHPPAQTDELGRLNGLMMLAGAFNSRGALYCDSKEFDKAVDDYTQAIRYCDSLNSATTFKTMSAVGFSLSPSPYAGRSAAYEKLGKHELAEADKKKAEEPKKTDSKKSK